MQKVSLGSKGKWKEKNGPGCLLDENLLAFIIETNNSCIHRSLFTVTTLIICHFSGYGLAEKVLIPHPSQSEPY